VIVEAWAPNRAACLEELVRGVVGTFADVGEPTTTSEIPLEVNEALDEDVVVAILQDVCYLLDADGLVVVDVELEEEEESGGFEGVFVVTPVGDVVATGAPPKGISRSDLSFRRDGSSWRCQVTLDV
jgi:SHS2 domain-containing protein